MNKTQLDRMVQRINAQANAAKTSYAAAHPTGYTKAEKEEMMIEALASSGIFPSSNNRYMTDYFTFPELELHDSNKRLVKQFNETVDAEVTRAIDAAYFADNSEALDILNSFSITLKNLISSAVQ